VAHWDGMERRDNKPCDGKIETLWWRGCAGDARAFAELVNVLIPRLLGIARRRCDRLSGNDPENVVGETLLAIAACPERISVKGRVIVRVLTIHRNKCVDQVRRLKSRPGSVNLFDEAVMSAPANGSSETSADPALTLDIVRACLGRLIHDSQSAPARREVYRLMHDCLGGKIDWPSYETMAQMWKCEVGAVKWRISDARHRLLAYLEDTVEQPEQTTGTKEQGEFLSATPSSTGGAGLHDP